jgi:protocatechuate 3,4-dioxygenase beta subunit
MTKPIFYIMRVHSWSKSCGWAARSAFAPLPALYSGRTRHYHLKVQAPGSHLLTTQLYFPNEPANLRDVLFQSELLMRVADAGDGLDGRFDFVLNVR